MPTLELKSSSLEQTYAIAEMLGMNLTGGEIVELVSDLGGGKTTFTKGLAKGAGSSDAVHSPSFTIENEYRTGKLVIHHLDFYRLNDPGIMKNELEEILTDPKAIVVIEWADIVKDLLPVNRLVIKIIADGGTTRKIQLDYPDNLEYLVKDLKN